MLSIGKLSYLAQLHEEIPPAINEDVLNSKFPSSNNSVFLFFLQLYLVAFHDGLDFISVHETLIESLRSSLQDVRTKQSLEQQVDIILRKQAASLAGRRSFYTVSFSLYLLPFSSHIYVLDIQTARSSAAAREGAIYRRGRRCPQYEG